MQRSDTGWLTERLTELAEALGAIRAPSARAIQVWLDVLGECHHDVVKGVLTDWPKSHGKMPVPAEILKACREVASVRLEQRTKEIAGSARASWSPTRLPKNTEVGRREMAKIRAILASPKPHPKAWMDRAESEDAREARLEREAMQSMEVF